MQRWINTDGHSSREITDTSMRDSRGRLTWYALACGYIEKWTDKPGSHSRTCVTLTADGSPFIFIDVYTRSNGVHTRECFGRARCRAYAEFEKIVRKLSKRGLSN